MIENVEQSLYRSVVDDEFRTLLVANPDLFGLRELGFPEAIEAEVQQDLADVSMADADVGSHDTTCSWGVTVRCDRLAY